IPVPIWEDHVAVRSLVLDPNSTRIAELLALRDQRNSQLGDALQGQLALGKTLVDLLAKSKHEEALAVAKKGLAGLQEDLQLLDRKTSDLLLQVTKAKLPNEITQDLLADGGRRKHLEAAQKQLTEFVADWTAQLQRKAEQRELAGLIAQARLLKN